MFDARRLYKYIAALYVCLFDTFDTLHVYVQNANASTGTNISNSFFATTIKSKDLSVKLQTEYSTATN